jgi:hypothetical protein
MELVHKERQRFNRNCIASSRGSYVMHAHKQMLSENHSSSNSQTIFADARVNTKVYYVKCWGDLIQIDAERAAMYPKDMIVIK